MELNPESPVLRQLAGQWHAVLAMVMEKNGIKSTDLTVEDITAMQKKYKGQMPAIVADSRDPKVLQIQLVTPEEVMALLPKRQDPFRN